MLKILFLKQNGLRQEYVIEEFVEQGFGVICYPWDQKQKMRNDEELQIEMEKTLKNDIFIFVFSINFFPIAASACKNSSIRYISWVYDSPCRRLYSATLSFTTNYVFIFDQALYLELRERGITTVYYLPLAAPVEYYDTIQCSESDRQKYQAQISFVGTMCTEKYRNFMDLIKDANEYTKGYLEALMDMQHELQDGFILEKILKEPILEELQRVYPLERESDEWETDAWIYANCLLAETITVKERSRYVELLSDKHDVKLYTDERAEYLDNMQHDGSVDYHTQMPLVFKNSSINLNVTRRSIHTGIPMRAMEIMGCGGFLLTNYQEELLIFFEPNVDFVFFENEEDLLEKAQYYLLHTEERNQIAKNGYEKVKKMHSYRYRAAAILSVVFPYNELNIYQAYDKIDDVRLPNINYKWYKDGHLPNPMAERALARFTDQRMNQMEKEKDLFLELEKICLDYMNSILAQGTETAWDCLVLWYNSRIGAEMGDLFRQFRYLSVFVEAYIWEKKMHLINNDPISVLQLRSMKQIEERYYQYEFLFWRIERDMPEEDQRELIERIKKYRMTETVLVLVLEKNLIQDKQKIYEKLNIRWRVDGE